MKEQIKQWLSGPREYNQGVELYKQYGYNKVLKNSFSRGETPQNAVMLVFELSQLAGVSEQEVKTMKRFAVVPGKKVAEAKIQHHEPDADELFIALAKTFGVNVSELFADGAVIEATESQKAAIDALKPKYNEIPELQKKVINFRETYPFLRSEDCPDELKILVADMFAAYDNYREAYRLLDETNTQDENLALAKTTVEQYLENRALWAELDHFKANGEILGEHPLLLDLKLQKEIKAVTDIDLPRKIGNARGNVTKNRNKFEAAKSDEDKAKYGQLLAQWTRELELYEAELEARKKQ